MNASTSDSEANVARDEVGTGKQNAQKCGGDSHDYYFC